MRRDVPTAGRPQPFGDRDNPGDRVYSMLPSAHGESPRRKGNDADNPAHIASSAVCETAPKGVSPRAMPRRHHGGINSRAADPRCGGGPALVEGQRQALRVNQVVAVRCSWIRSLLAFGVPPLSAKYCGFMHACRLAPADRPIARSLVHLHVLVSVEQHRDRGADDHQVAELVGGDVYERVIGLRDLVPKQERLCGVLRPGFNAPSVPPCCPEATSRTVRQTG